MFAFGHVLDKKSFLFLLDMEIKRARTYQDHLSLLSFTFGHLTPSNRETPSISLKTLANLIKNELRDTDVVGQDRGNKILIMLPNADMAEAHKVRARLEQVLHNYGFGRKGFAIEIDEVCFPTQTANLEDILRMAESNENEGHLL